MTLNFDFIWIFFKALVLLGSQNYRTNLKKLDLDYFVFYTINDANLMVL